MLADILNIIQPVKDCTLSESKQILPYFLGRHRLFFYDTCSFQKHACLADFAPLCGYIRQKNGAVVLIRCILTELAAESGSLRPEYIRYIRQLHENEIPVILLPEEFLFSVLDACFSSTVKINTFLFWAITTVHRSSSTISTALEADPPLLNKIRGRRSSDRTLFAAFFETVQNHKSAGDNLGEELLTICVHLLSDLPHRNKFQYLILTEDKEAIRTIGRAAENICKQLGFYTFSALTTTCLAEKLHEEGFLTEKSQITEFLKNPAGSPIRFFGSEEYDLAPQEKTMSAEELSAKIVSTGAIHINY